jgi:PAS domain S-box-containing protein
LIILNFNKYKIIISGIILGVLFWIIESIMHTLVFDPEENLIQHLFFSDAHELWMRTLVILFIAASSVYSQIIINKVKTNEQKLKESEEKYRLISENANDLIAILNSKFEHEYINEKTYQKILGYSNEDMLGKTRHDIIHPDDYKRAFKVLKDGFKKGEGTGELRLRHKNGNYIWVETKGSAFKDSDGQLKAITVSRDITERKKAEQKLKESEEKFRYFFNNAQVGLFWSRISDGKFIECNDTFAKLVGYDTREECLADYIALEHYVDSNIRDEMLEVIRINNEIKDFEIQVTKRDGTPYWASISARTNLKENRIEGAAIDVTARKEAEQKLKESEEKYRLISENANDLIYIFNERYEFEYINEQAFMKCLGHSKDDLIGKSTIEFIHPADLKRVSKELRKGFKSGRGRSELRIRHKNGTYRWLEVRGTLYIDKNEKRKALLIGRDVTEKKQAEKEIRESEVKYRHLFETSPYFIGLVNSEGILIDCNDAINDILSIHTIEDVVGKSFKEILLLNEKSTHLIPIFEKFIKSIFEGVNQEGFGLLETIYGYTLRVL